mgnify:FL=1|jgi:hypothetical protein
MSLAPSIRLNLRPTPGSKKVQFDPFSWRPRGIKYVEK